jgi:hypothetical protein
MKNSKRMESKRWAPAVFATVACLSGAALAQTATIGQVEAGHRPLFATSPMTYTIDTGPQVCTVYGTNENVVLPTQTKWRFMCGSDTAGKTEAELRKISADHEAQFGPGTRIVSVSPGYGERAGLTVNFVLAASVPAAAIPSFTRAATYLQAQFADTYTLSVNVSFANLGSGVIGATGSSYVNNTAYSTVRSRLISGKDGDDTIQDSLPTSLPVRRTSAGAANNIVNIDMTRANYNVLVGTATGSAGSMQYNSSFGFDFDPSDGVGAGLLSLTDTIVHETIHAMGFVSEADDSSNAGDLNTLDIFRFRRSTQNPTTLAEFTTFARLVSFNDPTADDVVSDIISGEWRMSDGNPWQASHFFQQSGNPSSAIGIMQPALADSVTFFPNYMKASDLAMIDAIGWDRGTACVPPSISVQPVSQTVCERSPVSFTVTAAGTNITYQWRRNTINLSGQTTNTFSLAQAAALNTATYDCVITGDCGTITTNAVTLTVNAEAKITANPANSSVCVGQPFSFSVTATGAAPLSYQWRKNSVNIPGANSSTYSGTASATPSALGSAGSFDCVVTGLCGTVTSAAATLSVNSGVQITSQPDAQTACVGGPFSFSVAATDTGAISYQWRLDSVNIPGANSSTFSGTANAADFGSYDCVLTGSCGSVFSSAAVLSPPDCVYGTCAADFDGSGGTPDAGDVDTFFADWLLGTPCADVDCSGGTPDSGDVDLFFALWLSGGC